MADSHATLIEELVRLRAANKGLRDAMREIRDVDLTGPEMRRIAEAALDSWRAHSVPGVEGGD